MNTKIKSLNHLRTALNDLDKAVAVSNQRWKFAKDRVLTVLPKLDIAIRAGASFAQVVPILAKTLKSKPRTQDQEYACVASMVTAARKIASQCVRLSA